MDRHRRWLMRPVTGNFLTTLRGPHTVAIRLDAWRAGARVGGTLEVLSGEVQHQAGTTSGPRRTLTAELAPTTGLWDALTPAGTTLVAYRGVRYVDGQVEWVRLGTFDVEEQNLSASPGGGLSITAPDVWNRVARARFETPRTHPAGSAHDNAVDLAVEAIGRGTGSLSGDSTAQVRSGVWERDREEAVTELARSAGAWVHTDPYGQVVSRPVPSLTQTPVWTVDASSSGVLLDATRSRSRQRTYNVVVVVPADTDGTVPFAPVVLADTDPTSPTYAGGSFGRVPYFYSSQLLTTATQAQATARSLLRLVRGMAAGLDITSAVNPALEPGDVIEVLLPARGGDPRAVERHLIDEVTVPLTVEGTQRLGTRSTRPEGDVQEGD